MIDADSTQTRLLAAQAIGREAGALARRRFLDSTFTVSCKGPQDYLTEVDRETEELIAARLHAVFPRDGFIGEETRERAVREGEAVWVVDPVDGTSNFARGVAHFCVSIACVSAGGIEVGVVYDPMRDELFAGRRGQGARLNGVTMRTASTTALANSSVEVGWNNRAGPAKSLDLLRRVASSGAAPLLTGSGALRVTYAAAGRRDGYVECHINAWDCLAGIPLVREAGGYVSDFLSGGGLNHGNPLIASAPGVKHALISTAAIEGSSYE